MNLIQQIQDNIQTDHLIKKGDTVVVGVSGGPDSVTLIHLLNKIKYDLGAELHIAHFNHNLRRGSLQDQEFVEQLAQELNTPISVEISKQSASKLDWANDVPWSNANVDSETKRMDNFFMLSSP